MRDDIQYDLDSFIAGLRRLRALPKILGVAAEVCGFLFAVIYIVFVFILMAIGFSNPILGTILIVITAAYLVFSLVNYFLLKRRRLKKTIKLTCRYTKYGMRLIHMVFIIAALIANPFGSGQLLAVVGIIILLATLVISLIIDITVFVLKLMFRDVKREIMQSFGGGGYNNAPPSMVVNPVSYPELQDGKPDRKK